jgi:hypothetical protein
MFSLSQRLHAADNSITIFVPKKIALISKANYVYYMLIFVFIKEKVIFCRVIRPYFFNCFIRLSIILQRL